MIRKLVTVLCTALLISMSCACNRVIIRGDSSPPLSRGERTVVWGNHPMMVTVITEWVKQGGGTVIERARLQEILNEQKTRLTHTPDDEAELLRVGRLLGAETLFFAEATETSGQYGSVTPSAYGPLGASRPRFHLSVAIRKVDIESGEVLWQRAALYEEAVDNPGKGIMSLTEAVLSQWD